MNITFSLVAQAVVFAAFIWFTKVFIWPHMLRAIEARQKTVADGLAAAEQGKKSLEASARQSEQTIQQARDRAAEIIAQAEKRGTQMVDEAQAEIEQQVSRAKEALREQVATLAVAGAEKILRREVDAKAHADLLAQLKQEMR
jgi:F-type H+-transporting ATPase subunit b